ncbi:MAG: exopolyphosphatase [Cytophagales bacterium]
MNIRIAVLDLGTNTFHLQITEIGKGVFRTLYKEKLAVQIGKHGISKGIITAEGEKRAIDALIYFKSIAERFHVKTYKAIATSAFRNAKNGSEIAALIYDQTGIPVEIIDGEREAELIYKGITCCISEMEESHMVVDIGGGSVEFIIGENSKIKWKKSIEIGGQRLMDKFHQEEPIAMSKVFELEQYLDEQLLQVKEAIEIYKPKQFIGSSGSFDTLDEIYRKKMNHGFDIEAVMEDFLPVSEFEKIYRDLLIKTKEERLQVPGMIPLRVEMIVVASVLIRKIISFMKVNEIIVSTCSLKDGVAKQELELI